MLGWIALSAIPTLCCGLFTIGLIILMILVPGVRDQGGAIFLTIMMGSFLAMGAWLTCLVFSLTFSGEPSLVINRAGIRVGKIYGSADIFLPWEEVEVVYSAERPPYTMFFVRPVDNKLFFSRLSPLMRLTCRLSTLSGEPIALYQSFLDQPVEAILAQMQKQYKRELQLHNKKPAEATHLQETGTREIKVSISRWYLLTAAVFLIMALVPGLILVFVGPWQLSGILISLLFLIGGTFIGSMTAWKILRVPILVVDDEGLASPYLLKHARIKWEEIDAIYCDSRGGHLWIDASPSGIVAFLTRRNKGRLVIPRSMDITVPQTVLTIPCNWFPLPSDRLLEQIRTRFRDKLEYYRIETELD